MEKGWDIVIRPQKKILELGLKDLWHYKDLLFLFVRRDFVAYYKQTILGPIWFLIQPVFTTLIFIIVFSRIAQIGTEDIPPALFYLSGLVNWTYFSECLVKTSNTFTANTSILGKVYFPRLIVPMSIVISNSITYGIQLMLFVVVLMYNVFFRGFSFHVSESIVLFPLIVLQIALLGLGCGIIVSSLTTKYKDLSFAIVFGVQLWMYATPIVYPMSQVSDKWKWLFYMNPMASVVEAFRNMVFDVHTINWYQYGIGWAITLLILLVGISLFTKVEKSFMDTI
jgi:lipopolysaccharide transport system permease protein